MSSSSVSLSPSAASSTEAIRSVLPGSARWRLDQLLGVLAVLVERLLLLVHNLGRDGVLVRRQKEVTPGLDLLCLLAGHAEHLGDRQQRELVGERHEVELVLVACDSSSSSSKIRWKIGSSSAVRLGVK